MVGLADGKSESGGESRMRLRLVDMGLPRPELQIPVEDMYGVGRFRLDMGWRHWRLALEYDGEEFHGPDSEEHDEARREWIRGRGWTVEVFRKEHIFTPSHAFEDAVGTLVKVARSAA
jgi:very-short-patch-repair endonuclease